jgi:hypothetical protein
MPAALEWWAENFALVRDIFIRRYAVHAQSYDGLLRDPERVVRETIAWLGRGEAERALKAPKPEHRNFQRVASDGSGGSVPREAAEVFDELYAAIDQRKELSKAFLLRLNETNERLAPEIDEHKRRIATDIARRRAKGKGDPAPERRDLASEPPASGTP